MLTFNFFVFFLFSLKENISLCYASRIRFLKRSLIFAAQYFFPSIQTYFYALEGRLLQIFVSLALKLLKEIEKKISIIIFMRLRAYEHVFSTVYACMRIFKLYLCICSTRI